MFVKVFEKIYIKRIKSVTEENIIIPEHQLGFCEKHGIIEQVHRLVKQINKDLNA